MAAPWERYQQAAPQAAPQDGPWAKYQAPTPNQFANVQGGSDTVAAAPPEQPGYWSERGQELRGIGEGLRYSVAETALGLGQLVGAADTQDVEAFRTKRDAMAQEYGTSFDGGKAVGDIGQTFLPVGAVGKGTKLAQMGKAALGGGALGATRTTGEGESRLQNTAVGAGLGALGQGLSTVMLRLGEKAAPQLRDLYNTAKAQGINLTPAQMSNSEFFKRFAGMMDKLPLSGAAARREAQQESFSRAVAKTVGEYEPMDQVVYANALTRLGDNFERRAGAHDVPVSVDFVRALGTAIRETEETADEVTAKAVKSVLNRVMVQSGTNGALPGKAAQSLDGMLRRMQEAGGERAAYAGRLRDALHDDIEAALPAAEAALWRQDRQQYRNLMAITDMVARDNGVSPAKLMGRVTATRAQKKAMASGRGGDLGQLARIGQQMKAPPSSGTAENLQAAGLGYNALANPAGALLGISTGNLAGRAVNSNALASYLMSPDRGRILNALAPVARPLPLLFGRPAYAEPPERPRNSGAK